VVCTATTTTSEAAAQLPQEPAMRASSLSIALVLSAFIAAPITAGDDVAKAKRSHREELLQRFDADGNGKLDAKERAAMRAAKWADLKLSNPKQFALIDTNTDGAVSDVEAKTWKDAQLIERDQRQKQLHPEAFAQADANSDGKLDRSERKALKTAVKAEKAEQKTLMDTNRDGKVDRKERRDYSARLRSENP